MSSAHEINRIIMYKAKQLLQLNKIIFKINDKVFTNIKIIRPDNLDDRDFINYTCEHHNTDLIIKWCNDTNIRRITRIEKLINHMKGQYTNYEIDQINKTIIFNYSKSGKVYNISEEVFKTFCKTFC
jgi:hypothetical protein